MGAHLNAYTSREQTVYYAKAFSKDIPQGATQNFFVMFGSHFWFAMTYCRPISYIENWIMNSL